MTREEDDLLLQRLGDELLISREARAELVKIYIQRDAMLVALQQIAALPRYDPNRKAYPNRPSTRSTINVPVGLLELIDDIVKGIK